MNENAKKWVAALRSGEYQQTVGWLRDSQGYCCLGVACDLYAQEHPECSWLAPAHTPEDAAIKTMSRTFVTPRGKSNLGLPEDVQKWLCLRDCNGSFFDAALLASYVCLASLNDSGKYSFKQIADIIEAHYGALFYE